MDVMLASPPEVASVYTGYHIVDRASGKVTGQMIPAKRGDLSKALLMDNCIGGTSSVLIKKDCFKKVGMFDETLRSFQDYDLWIRISRWFQFDYVKEPLLKYHVHQKQIWTNLDALSQGMEIMLGKHGDSPHLRKYFSYQYLSLGVNFCYMGNVIRGRESYIQAIRLYPFEIRHYFNLGLSFFGVEIFTRIKRAKERLQITSREESPFPESKGA